MSNPMNIPYDYSLTYLSVNRFTDLFDLLENNFIQYFPFLQTIGLYLPQPPPSFPGTFTHECCASYAVSFQSIILCTTSGTHSTIEPN